MAVGLFFAFLSILLLKLSRRMSMAAALIVGLKLPELRKDSWSWRKSWHQLGSQKTSTHDEKGDNEYIQPSILTFYNNI